MPQQVPLPGQGLTRMQDRGAGREPNQGQRIQRRLDEVEELENSEDQSGDDPIRQRDERDRVQIDSYHSEEEEEVRSGEEAR
jgi:hypothetical protein